MEESESESESSFDHGGFGFVPSRVSLTPFTPVPPPSSRRLSSSFYEPSRPLSSARKLAYVSLQGRLVNADEATSARTIGGGLSRDQAVAWEMFTPIQRVILVAVIGVAVSESKKNRIISNLQKSVQLRDQVLSSMQQKLDSLCEQVNNNNNNAKDQQGSGEAFSDAQDSGFPLDAPFKSNGMDFVDCGCWLCDQHHKRLYGLVSHSLTKASSVDVTSFIDEAEPEERRMSDLSDWASSVTSSAEIQVNGLALEQDITNLKKECEEKDATIRELTSFLQTSDTASSKRISELEDVIRRKNMIITKLKKDLVVLEQKVVQLTRLRRPSSSSSSIDADTRHLPVMAENLLYDMDSTTSHSSDSDSSPVSRQMATTIKIQETPKEENDDALCNEMATMINQKNQKEKNDNTLRRDQFSSTKRGSKIRHTDKYSQSRYDSPLKEISMNQKSSRISYFSQRQRSSSGGDSNRNKRHAHSGSKGLTPMKRWS